MNSKLLWFIAGMHIITRLKQSVVAGLGVTFGIATFITLISFMTGLNGLLDGLTLDRTPHIHLYNETGPSQLQPLDLLEGQADDWKIIHSVKPKNQQSRIYAAQALMNTIKSYPEVAAVSPLVSTQAFYTAGAIDLNGMVIGIDVREEDRWYKIGDYVSAGSVAALEQNDNAIIIGAGVAKKLSTDIGNKIQLVSPRGNSLSLKIVGLYQSGLAEIDDVQSYVNLKTAQRLMGETGSYVTDINIKLYDLEKALPLARRFQRLYGIKAVDIGTANAQFDTGTSIRNIITYAVSITLLIVAGFGIYNILNMFIHEKMNDIAILKATGFSGADVMKIFILQAMTIGLVGGVVGLSLGWAFSYIISQIPFEIEALPTVTTYPVNFNSTYYFIGMAFALVATFFAGYLPANRARKMDPVDVLRRQ